MNNFFHTSFIFIIISVIFIIICFSSTLSILTINNNVVFENSILTLPDDIILNFSNSKFLWPTPGFTTITSQFGYRDAPTSGASSYHSGIDIGAPARGKYFSYFFWNSNLYWF